MNTLLKVIGVVVLAGFATLQAHAACGDGTCDKDKKDKTEQKDGKK